jgi:hypothetical protein
LDAFALFFRNGIGFKILSGFLTELFKKGGFDVGVAQIISGISLLFGEVAKENSFDVIVRDIFGLDNIFSVKQALKGFQAAGYVLFVLAF